MNIAVGTAEYKKKNEYHGFDNLIGGKDLQALRRLETMRLLRKREQAFRKMPDRNKSSSQEKLLPASLQKRHLEKQPLEESGQTSERWIWIQSPHLCQIGSKLCFGQISECTNLVGLHHIQHIFKSFF